MSCAFLAGKGKLACDKDAIKVKSWFQERLKTQDDFSKANNWYRIVSYNDKAYVIQGSCCTNCRWRPTYFDCEGNEMIISNEDRKPLADKWKHEGEVIWKGTNCKD